LLYFVSHTLGSQRLLHDDSSDLSFESPTLLKTLFGGLCAPLNAIIRGSFRASTEVRDFEEKKSLD
jgi:hypothetical protein